MDTHKQVPKDVLEAIRLAIERDDPTALETAMGGIAAPPAGAAAAGAEVSLTSQVKVNVLQTPYSLEYDSDHDAGDAGYVVEEGVEGNGFMVFDVSFLDGRCAHASETFCVCIALV
jgi:hypothetical protein